MAINISLKGKVILVTGGYGHLGKAITDSLLQHDAKVYVLARSEIKFEDSFGPEHPNVFFIDCDISDTLSIQNSFKRIDTIEGRIDVLINNAYYTKGQSPESMSDEDWTYGIDGTLNSVFRAIREVLPYIRKSQNGKIINIASMYGMVAPQFEVYDESPLFLNPPHYGAAKAGIIQLTKYYASFLGPEQITVNTVSPGPFPSPSVQNDKTFIDQLSKKTCIGRIGHPDDLGGIFTFLASDAANFITGQNIAVDGGWTAK